MPIMSRPVDGRCAAGKRYRNRGACATYAVYAVYAVHAVHAVYAVYAALTARSPTLPRAGELAGL